MNLKNIIISASVLTVGILSINAIRKGEPKDTLDKRKFTVTMTEIKEGAPAKKGVEDELEFKAGKGMFSNFLFEKLEYKWIKYEITKDSTYTDEEENENHYTEAEISTTDANDQTMIMKCVVDNLEISGEIKITKKDKLKKKYEFSGKEKATKKK
ncbi:MAG: hypothetical protein K9H41_07425 [Bacteroidia bacterium]|jgi:hypothetical protein|nr:hypothetical protein [Bacteroidia bacterium]